MGMKFLKGIYTRDQGWLFFFGGLIKLVLALSLVSGLANCAYRQPMNEYSYVSYNGVPMGRLRDLTFDQRMRMIEMDRQREQDGLNFLNQAAIQGEQLKRSLQSR
jgi:hypothetical protein